LRRRFKGQNHGFNLQKCGPSLYIRKKGPRTVTKERGRTTAPPRNAELLTNRFGGGGGG